MFLAMTLTPALEKKGNTLMIWAVKVGWLLLSTNDGFKKIMGSR